MYLIKHNLRAQKDLLVAAEWYELQQKGLGEKFIDEYENLEYCISLNPRLFPEKYRSAKPCSYE